MIYSREYFNGYETVEVRGDHARVCDYFDYSCMSRAILLRDQFRTITIYCGHFLKYRRPEDAYIITSYNGYVAGGIRASALFPYTNNAAFFPKFYKESVRGPKARQYWVEYFARSGTLVESYSQERLAYNKLGEGMQRASLHFDLQEALCERHD